MSEYQYVSFRAIDRPVSDKNLEYMEKQSSHAEISKWSFSSEYHFGDFHGNAIGMLRKGYDLHLHYANFGTRTLMIRLPDGFPDEDSTKMYLDGDGLRFERDKNGQGGSLVVEPAYEPDQLEELWDWDLEELMDRLVPLRAEILGGDLRPFYLARLAIAQDMNHDPDEALEGPVPAGLEKLTDAQLALATLYGLGKPLIVAAAQGAPALPAAQQLQTQQEHWIRSQPAETKDRWLSELLSDPRSAVRSEIQDAFRKENSAGSWPTVALNRSLAELQGNADHVATRMQLQAAEEAARKRAKKLATMAANPTPYLQETDKLVKTYSTSGYAKAAELLADLREALAGTPKADLPEAHAQKLRQDNPTKYQLRSALEKAGFEKKKTGKRK